MKKLICAEQMKIATLSYWRYERKHMIGGIEIKDADVLTVTKKFMLTESEVKVSMADMQREVTTKRYKHMRMNGLLSGLYSKAHYFYFVVPAELQEKALEVIQERYHNTGLLVYDAVYLDIYNPKNISVVRSSKRFKRQPLDVKEMSEIAYGVSNTATRYINKWLKGNEVES